MKLWLRHIIIFVTIIGIGGLVMMLSGVISIGASSGHWSITEKILDFSMSRSINTYSIGIEAPEINRSWMVQKGAGHYEISCRQCHGGPGNFSNFLGQHMTPKAPQLAPNISHWEKEELFRIVKHGVKFTGMPAWPALQRDDEVWAMVAFLLKLPGMTEQGYKKLVYANHENSGALSCINCHGSDGNGRESSAFPKLAGQSYTYLKKSLHAYIKGERHSGIMQTATASLNEDMIEKLALFYSKQKRISTVIANQDTASIERGFLIAHKGIPGQKVASCIGCHGPLEDVKKFNPHYPELHGQFAEYIELQIKLFLKGLRKDSEFSHLMHQSLKKMSEQQIKDVARYYESLPGSSD